MTPERERQAFEALIVAAAHPLLERKTSDEEFSEENLPPLSEEGNIACDSLKVRSVRSILERGTMPDDRGSSASPMEAQGILPLMAALHRGDPDLSSEAQEELDRLRKEVIEELDTKKDGDGDADAESCR